MIHHINSISSFKSAIANDIDNPTPSASRYPIRLIFLNSLDVYNQVVKIISKKSNINNLADSLPHSDGWFTSEEILKTFKSCSSTTLIMPLSEILRFTNKETFYSLMVSMFEIENPSDKLLLPV